MNYLEDNNFFIVCYFRIVDARNPEGTEFQR